MSDWTVDPETGRSNSSAEYLALVGEVSRLIRDGAHSLMAGNSISVARTIMSQLAHVHGMAPVSNQDDAPAKRTT